MKTMMVANSMGLALAQAALKSGKSGEVQKRVIENIQRDGVGMHKVPEWNAHLKLKTYNQLKDAGVMR